MVAPTPPRAPTTATSLPSFRLIRVPPAVSGGRGQRFQKQLRGHRLDDVFADPGIYQVAIEANVVSVTDRNYCDTGLAKLGELMHPRSRHLDTADIDNDDLR